MRLAIFSFAISKKDIEDMEVQYAYQAQAEVIAHRFINDALMENGHDMVPPLAPISVPLELITTDTTTCQLLEERYRMVSGAINVTFDKSLGEAIRKPQSPGFNRAVYSILNRSDGVLILFTGDKDKAINKVLQHIAKCAEYIERPITMGEVDLNNDLPL